MTVFYRKYRPQKFSEITGQEHIKKTLLGQLESGKISHGYLFSGPRGTGKTSTARILAKAVNCEVFRSEIIDNSKKLKTQNSRLRASFAGMATEAEQGLGGQAELRTALQRFGEPCNKCLSCKSITDGSNLDLIEVDAASNRGIDEIRDLREKIKLSPVSSRFKVYIIDEVHMLTNEAFNALLKTLEEPPAHAIFILCTTEPNKLPETIVSRLVRLKFSRATIGDLDEYVASISKKEGIKIDKEAILAIAKEADGSYRDSASILDQLAASGELITSDDVREITKASGFGQALEILSFLFKHDLKNAVITVTKFEGSVDFGKLTVDLISLLKEMLISKIGVGAYEYDTQVESLAGEVSTNDIKSLIRLFLIAEGEMRLYPEGEIPLILAFCDFCGDDTAQDSKEKVNGSVQVRVEKSDDESIPDDEVKKQVKDAFESDLNRDPQPKGRGSLIFAQDSLHPEPRGFSAQNKLTIPESLAEIEAEWGKFLDKVKSVNAHVMAVLRNSRPVAFDGKIVTLEVFFSFHKDKLQEPKIMDILCVTISEVMGKNISFKLVLSDRKSKVPRVVSKSDLLEVDAAELTLVAQEIFAK